ncbi:MAG: SAM-dependent methyltransferase [bacterium]|nr:SAM-dependent methyltransferase [bacterium]
MNEGHAAAFAQRARAYWTEAELRRVTEGKDLLVLPTTAPVLLRTLGLLHRDASMPPPQVRKFLQLNHMLRLLRPPLLELMERGEPLHIVDAGCGLSYLTLSLAWCLRHVFGHAATLLGLDRRADLVDSCRTAAERVGLADCMTFCTGDVDEFESDRPIDVVLALHACDVATDHAIALGLRHEASLIAVAPCCQAELANAWAELAGAGSRTADADRAPLHPLWNTPHLRREAAATVTDTMRMLLLQACGYDTRVVEFVPSRHTPKNTLIRAMRRGHTDPAAAIAYRDLRTATGGAGIALEECPRASEAIDPT